MFNNHINIRINQTIFKWWCRTMISIIPNMFLKIIVFSKIILRIIYFLIKIKIIVYRHNFKIKVRLAYKCFKITIIIKPIKFQRVTKSLYQINFTKVSNFIISKIIFIQNPQWQLNNKKILYVKL